MNGTGGGAASRTFLIVSEVLRRWVKPREGEQVLIVADTESDFAAVQAVMAASYMYKAEPVIMTIRPTFLEGTERYLPATVLKALEEADIYFPMTATTGHSAHSYDVAAALYDKSRKKNIRMFAFGGWVGGTTASAIEALRFHDYDEVMRIGKRFEQYLNPGKEIRVTSEAGTDLVASIDGIPYRTASAIVTEPGQAGGINVGECYGGPVEFTAEGTVAIDGPIAGVTSKPVLSEPVIVTLRHGRVVDVKGGEEAEAFKRFLDTNEDADMFAEISPGTNPYLRLTGNANANDKWILGTVHVAFGQTTFQLWPHGTVDASVHNDAVMLKPSCWVDGKQIIKEGQPLV